MLLMFYIRQVADLREDLARDEDIFAAKHKALTEAQAQVPAKCPYLTLVDGQIPQFVWELEPFLQI